MPRDVPLQEPASRFQSVKALPVGARFCYRGEVWRVRHNASYVDVEAEQFSNHLTFYDPVTAHKSGDLCWDTPVERIRG